MGWATSYIAKLKNGETVKFRPRGNSMSGRIESGQLVTVEPVTDLGTLALDEIVLCSVNGGQFLHIIKGKQGNGQFLIATIEEARTGGLARFLDVLSRSNRPFSASLPAFGLGIRRNIRPSDRGTSSHSVRP